MIYHYYGDIVRKIFLGAAFLMTLTLPMFYADIPGRIEFSVVAIPLLVLAAGLTNPRQHWVSFLNVILSLLGSVVFEYYAVLAYKAGGMDYFAVNQMLTVLFLFGIYWSVKTYRGRKHEKDIADMD